MNREEKRNAAVGAMVLVLIAALIALLFSASNKESVSDRYVVIASFPERSGLEEGSGVFVGGKRVGEVQKLSEEEPGKGVAVRMKVAEAAFASLGPESKAWIEYATAERKARIIILPGNASDKARFVKIKPVRGVTPPGEGGH